MAKAYLAYLAKTNAADISRFQEEAKAQPNTANFDLRKLAHSTIAALEEQQATITEIRAKLSGVAK